MAFANVNLGSRPDDGTGDPLRVAFGKINQNFANISANLNYTMGNADNWTSSVTTVGAALDQLAARLKLAGF